MIKNNLNIAAWVLGGLLPAAALALAFVPIVESISTAEPHIMPTTLFQHGGIPGPSDPIMKAVLYVVGLSVLVLAALRLSLRYGVVIATAIFGFSTFLTTGSIHGLVGGWVLLPAWSLLATGTILSGGLLWLKVVEWIRTN